jgi:hypothetical protein
MGGINSDGVKRGGLAFIQQKKKDNAQNAIDSAEMLKEYQGKKKSSGQPAPSASSMSILSGAKPTFLGG